MRNIYMSIDFNKQVSYSPQTFVKNDYNSIKFNFNTSQNITDKRVFVAFEMSDGTKYLEECTVESSTLATLELPTGVLSVEGEVIAQVALYDGTASRLTAPVQFKYTVSEDLSDEAVTPSDNVPILTQLITEIDELKTVGDYDSGTTYKVNNFVHYNNNLYVAIAETTGNLPTNTTYWRLAVENISSADSIVYDNAISGLTATDVKNAIDEIDSDLDAHKADIVPRVETLERGVLSFGLEWNQSTDTYTRLNNALGLSVVNSSSPHISDFSDYYPWKGMKRCNLNIDGTVNAYYGEDGYADNGSNGNVMVEIPKFYYKTVYDTTTDNVWKWYVSTIPLNGYELHPAFKDAGQEKDYIYVGAYEGYNNTGTLESKSGVAPTVSQTIGTFRTQAQANATGFGILDYTSLTAIQMLYLVEYGSLYSQNVLSEGITDDPVTDAQDTGATTSLGNGSGEVVVNDTQAMSYRGIENFYGNVWKFIDGILVKDDGYYFGNSIDDYNDSGTSYLHIDTTPTTTDGYGSNFENLTNFDFAFMINETSGSSITYVTDYLYAHDTGEINIALFGGIWVNGSTAGVFLLTLNTVASIASSTIGARICFK